MQDARTAAATRPGAPTPAPGAATTRAPGLTPAAVPAVAAPVASPYRERPWYPLFVAFWVVLRLAAANVADVVGPGDLVGPLVLAGIGALAAMVVARLCTRDPDRRGLVALVLVVWYSLFVDVHRWIFESLLAFVLLPLRSPLLATGLVVAAVVLAAARLPIARPALTRFLNVAGVALMLLPLTALAEGFWQHRKALALEWPLPPLPAAAKAVGRPDVYLVILDKYTGPASLLQNYGFDEEPFLRALEARGFVVPRHARSNYTLTHLSLSSMLNWEYLPGSPTDSTHVDDALPVSYARIETNRTAELFRKAGYRYVLMPSGYAATASSRRADQTLGDGESRESELERTWRTRSLLAPLDSILAPFHDELSPDELDRCHTVGVLCRLIGRRLSLHSPASIAGGFDMVAAVARDSGPKFVFAHFTVPHDPYLFEADCSYRRHVLRMPGWPHPAHGRDELVMKAAYTAQVQCVNRMVLALVDSLDRHSRTRPVIVLQSDHGNGRIGAAYLPMDRLERDRVAERFDIFAAYRYPGAAKVVHDSIAPINAIPAMLNAVLGTSIPPRPDHRYWATWHAPFRLVPVE